MAASNTEFVMSKESVRLKKFRKNKGKYDENVDVYKKLNGNQNSERNANSLN